MFKELIFANKKTINNNHLSLERSVLTRVFFIKNTQRKINSGRPLQAALEWINCKRHCSLDSESQATKNFMPITKEWKFRHVLGMLLIHTYLSKSLSSNYGILSRFAIATTP